jgi:hypothetical protein
VGLVGVAGKAVVEAQAVGTAVEVAVVDTPDSAVAVGIAVEAVVEAVVVAVVRVASYLSRRKEYPFVTI